MSTMGCIPEFLKCQWVGEKTWPGGKEAEGSWIGRWVREKVTDTLLAEQMGTSSNSCPTQDSEPRKRCEEKNPRARAWRHFAIADILSGWWWETELVLWIQTSSLVMQIPEVLHRGLKLLPWQRLSYGHQYMHTQEWGSHIQHRLALMLTVSLFMSNLASYFYLLLILFVLDC